MKSNKSQLTLYSLKRVITGYSRLSSAKYFIMKPEVNPFHFLLGKMHRLSMHIEHLSLNRDNFGLFPGNPARSTSSQAVNPQVSVYLLYRLTI